jgi:hypothetical protein
MRHELLRSILRGLGLSESSYGLSRVSHIYPSMQSPRQNKAHWELLARWDRICRGML